MLRTPVMAGVETVCDIIITFKLKFWRKVAATTIFVTTAKSTCKMMQLAAIDFDSIACKRRIIDSVFHLCAQQLSILIHDLFLVFVDIGLELTFCPTFRHMLDLEPFFHNNSFSQTI